MISHGIRSCPMLKCSSDARPITVSRHFDRTQAIVFGPHICRHTGVAAGGARGGVVDASGQTRSFIFHGRSTGGAQERGLECLVAVLHAVAIVPRATTRMIARGWNNWLGAVATAPSGRWRLGDSVTQSIRMRFS